LRQHDRLTLAQVEGFVEQAHSQNVLWNLDCDPICGLLQSRACNWILHLPLDRRRNDEISKQKPQQIKPSNFGQGD